ncbi:hypothetical protein [Actinomadura atramentaria]|uniref:hypothetical protein n=1 Tax=Actinomadura atramentaria TaxID=1990 RepID=UPI000374136B|nr:hypothetical protein [Actinomadura atramentaria]
MAVGGPEPGGPPSGGVPATVVPQRERVTLLVHLSGLVAALGLPTAFAVIDGRAVLNVLPPADGGRAATVGCRYRAGRWWFYDVRTGADLAPTRDLAETARLVRAAVTRTLPPH